MFKESREWMPFYGEEFFGDINVQAMERAERGMYLHLIWLCWSEGSIPDDPAKLAVIFGEDPAIFSQGAWAKLRPRFVRCKDGRLIHPWIEKIRAELNDELEDEGTPS